MKDWPQTVTELTSHLRNLRGGAPEVMKAFSNIAHAALAAKALDGKTKELIALGISVDLYRRIHAMSALSLADPVKEVRLLLADWRPTSFRLRAGDFDMNYKK